MTLPVKISLDLSNRVDRSDAVYAWCFEQFGPENINWWRAVSGTFPCYTFWSEQDAMMFALRWK